MDKIKITACPNKFNAHGFVSYYYHGMPIGVSQTINGVFLMSDKLKEFVFKMKLYK